MKKQSQTNAKSSYDLGILPDKPNAYQVIAVIIDKFPEVIPLLQEIVQVKNFKFNFDKAHSFVNPIPVERLEIGSTIYFRGSYRDIVKQYPEYEQKLKRIDTNLYKLVSR